MSENTGKISQGNKNTSQALNNISKKLNKELEEMKRSLSGDGISSEELKQMSKGFITMGENLSDLSDGLSEMAAGGGMFPDTSDVFNSLKEDIGNEVSDMTDNLSGGISPEELKTMSDGFITMGDNLSKISDGLKTFHEKSGMMIPYFPHNQEELDNILYEDGKLRDVFSDTIIDENHMMAMIKLNGNLEDSEIDSIYKEVSNAMEAENFDVNFIVSGKPVLDSSLRAEMKSNMVIMVASAVVLMLIILNLVFRVRWKSLSLGIIFVSVIATLGLMGHLNVSMTMVSMAVFPILIGLGIDYSIQFQNRYEEEHSVKTTGLSVFGIVADTKVGVETDIETFMPQDMDALHDIHYIRDVVGSTNQMVIFMEDENLLSESNLDWMRSITNQAKTEFSNKIVDIKYIDDPVGNFSDIEEINFDEYMEIIEKDIPESQRKMFINDDNKAVILMNVEHMATAELQEFVEDMNTMLEDAPIKTSITGKSVLDVEMVKGLTDGRLKMTAIGLGLVLLTLLILYRSFFKALAAVIPVVLIVGMSGGIMNLIGLKYTPITATLGALVLGMGTEMTIMFLERYMEERNGGKEKRNALFTTMKFLGKATLASGLTTVGGFSVLMASKFVILKDFGLMTVINISLALMSTFIILPALLWIMDRLIVDGEVRKRTYKKVTQ